MDRQCYALRPRSLPATEPIPPRLRIVRQVRQEQWRFPGRASFRLIPPTVLGSASVPPRGTARVRSRGRLQSSATATVIPSPGERGFGRPGATGGVRVGGVRVRRRVRRGRRPIQPWLRPRGHSMNDANPCPDRPGRPQSVTLDRRRDRLTVWGLVSGPILLRRVADRIGRQFRGRIGAESGK